MPFFFTHPLINKKMDTKSMAVLALIISAALLVVAAMNYFENKRLRERLATPSVPKPCSCSSCSNEEGSITASRLISH